MKKLSKIIFIFLINYVSQAQNLTICETDCYRNYRKFFYSDGIAPWTIPDGVTKIKIELWGAGGASNAVAGGGGGGYAQAIFNVTPGETLSIYVAPTGRPAAGTGRAESGGNTRVFTARQSVTIGGGGGATPDGVGAGGGSLTTIGNPPVFSVSGKSGEITKINYTQISTAKFARITQYGNGGFSGNAHFPNGSVGGYNVYNLSAGVNIQNIRAQVGAEGGGGAGSEANGTYGGRGLVIVHY